MNADELREAIERQKLCLIVPPIFEQDVEDVKLLISLAEFYLSIKGMPEEKSLGGGVHNRLKAIHFNECLAEIRTIIQGIR